MARRLTGKEFQQLIREEIARTLTEVRALVKMDKVLDELDETHKSKD